MKNTLIQQLKINEEQITIKKLSNLTEYYTIANIDNCLQYYNLPWSEYQLINNEILLDQLNVLLLSKNLNSYQRRSVHKYKKLIERNKSNIMIHSTGKLRYPYRNNTLLLEDKTQKDPLDEDVLTFEDYMCDAKNWLFKEDED